MKTLSILLFCMLCSIGVFSQSDESLFSRLQAVNANKIDFYNIDGYEISSQKFDTEFSKKSILKNYKRAGIREADLTITDSILKFNNIHVEKTEEKVKGVVLTNSYYFIESPDNKLTGISFAAMNKSDKDFERTFVTLIRDNAIPKTVFNSIDPDSINFAGRNIAAMDPGCRYMGVNNVQCPSNGQMSWSLHKTQDDASRTVDDHWKLISQQRGGKVLSDTVVKVIFEGKETTAKKMVYGFKGINAMMAKMDGAKTLIVYAVACPVKDNFISCVMSFWNIDSVNKNGLPELLGKVMVLR